MISNFKTSKHSFHLVDPSPWPLISGFAAFFFTFGTVLNMHGYSGGSFLWKFGFFLILYVMYSWWKDVVREATIEGQHTYSVQNGLKLGVILFIVSEVMFFFAFFWAFFHSSFNPSPLIGGVWPPAFMSTIDPWSVPLFNTFILLTSGATVTLAHHLIITGFFEDACESLFITIILAIFFYFVSIG